MSILTGKRQTYPSSSALFADLEEYKKYFFLFLWLLSLLSLVYLAIVKFRFWLYKKGFKKVTQLSLPVVSLGNLTVGGTGKTPILIYLTHLLRENGHRIGIVSRNYRAKSQSILKVNPSESKETQDGLVFGDEPLLIYQKTLVPVYIGPRKVDTAKELVREEKIDIVIVDDGFQHLPLKKNCNIVLFDVTQMDENNYLLPRGRYREPFAGYKKSDIIFWTKTNFISDAQLAELKKKVDFPGVQVDWRFELTEIQFPDFPNLDIDFRKNLAYMGKIEFLSIRRFVLVSAIARPEYFRKIVQDLNPKNELFEKVFRDHHQYTEADLKIILDKPLNFHHFLTTEKDYTKLKDLWPKDVPLGIVKWETRPNMDDQTLYESINSYLH